MKIPDILKIGGHWFNIEFQSEKKTQYDRMGTLCHWENRILIQQDLIESKQISSFFHEILHEIDKQTFSELTEKQVTIIAEHIYQVLTDNGLLK